MSNELVQRNDSSSLISVIERVATNPDADIAKLEKMLELNLG